MPKYMSQDYFNILAATTAARFELEAIPISDIVDSLSQNLHDNFKCEELLFQELASASRSLYRMAGEAYPIETLPYCLKHFQYFIVQYNLDGSRKGRLRLVRQLRYESNVAIKNRDENCTAAFMIFLARDMSEGIPVPPSNWQP